jgi:D-alanyl-D-alanine carboxypeptidase
MALIMQEAMQNPVFRRIISAPYTYLPPVQSHPEYRQIFNTNRLIREDLPEYNEWLIGGKTGFTNAAQNTFVTYSYAYGHSIIISTLHVSQRAALFSDMNDLIVYTFTNLIEVPYEYSYSY